MIAGRYSLEREVGRGGMGTVWLARDETLARQVAIKRVAAPPGDDNHDMLRAEREARLAASIDHPNVVSVLDLVIEDDTRWLVMEFVDGDTLSALVRRDGPLDPERATDLLRQAAEALATAHDAGIVHRDVKPSNMLVTRDGRVKLTDFGIARAESDATITRTGVLTGSPAYLAPEVASGGSATQASDVWSLGATLFHCLAGRPPYETGDNVMGTLFRIVHEDPPRLEDPGALGPLLEATMAKDPAQRWSMRQVVDFLHGGDPGVPAPEETQRLAAVPPADDTPAEGTTTPAPVAPRPSPAAAGSRRAGRRPAAPVLLGLAAAAVVAFVVVLVLRSQDPTPAPTAVGGSGSASGASGSSSPSAQPNERARMESFVADYLTTVTSDHEAAWQRLTPAFQDASGGFDSYRGWWSTIADAEVLDIRAHPASSTVDYTVRYTRQDGSTVTEDVTLRLEATGDGYLIADEA